MGEPTERFQTFAQGDIPAMEFWNEWIQDGLVGVRADVDAATANIGTNQGTMNAHIGSSTDPHGAIQVLTGKLVAPLFESTSPAESRFLDPSLFTPDGSPELIAFTTHGGLYVDTTDSLPHKLVAPLALRIGDVLTNLEVYANRTAGSMRVELLRRDSAGSSTTVLDVNVTGTGDTGVSWTGSHTVSTSAWYQLRLTMNVAGTAANLYFYGLKVGFNRTRR